MTPPEAERPRSKQVNFGNVRYDISVTEISGGLYQATWTCSMCKEEGAWTPISADANQAIALAKIGIEVHHRFLHR